ncbi:MULTISPECIES: sulfatase [unclassified Lentimonas]|uniref:sulfatase n=1 Tax=unclassified Lentimonas TaxID=2630993 RepID=UPI001322E66F|nr:MULTISPECIES: sulfatase [unclassified Lentimonas]CAA6692184.1 Choline-sulfatase (EC [Lentimonas sp. CC10]CAA6696459.1 Choline-sulfatase (EC [Lentimonas sp. CC19]CAA7071888.1 Choline-sulfatase (EC [Lentimonas sp. CC11]
MKRSYLKSYWLYSLALVVGVPSLLAAAEKPNILLIIIDDMGWKDISVSGSAYYETPHIDGLAREGLRFTNAYSAAPTCTPSRGAIYSGKFPARTKLTAVYNRNEGPDDRLYAISKYQGKNDQTLEALHRHALPSGEFILPQALAAGGYTTGFFGKWHIGECANYQPDDRGFDVAKGYRTSYVPTSKSGHWMKTFSKYGAHLEGVDPDAYVADVLTDECIDFISKNHDKRWMAVLSHYLVHSPVQPKPEKLAHYQQKRKTDQGSPGYASMVESVDESVGRVLQALKALKLDENTMVIFTSDNGGLTLKNTSNYPLMGGKSFPFEGGTKVPFIVKWPSKVDPGISGQRIVGTDIYPTLLSAAGLLLRPEQHVDGVDLMPVLTEKATLEPRPIIVHYPHYTHATGPFSSITEGGWKLIRFYNDEFGAYLLYDLDNDPHERYDLTVTNPEKVARLAAQLDRALTEMQAEMPRENLDYTPSNKALNLKTTKALANKEWKLFEARQ